ncbi:hypothetical protein GCM10023198_20640 [Promicromonospora umidemergens]|uniref:Integrase-like protein n=1 Tax=Promicromonospora umidemergens TaxID=629679 RepID=A0ABP8X719_9MICO
MSRTGLGASSGRSSVRIVARATTTLWPETVNGPYKTELVHARPAWPSVAEVEYATMDRVR